MPWLKHPAYARVSKELAEKLQSRLYYFGRTQPLVFLCGGHESQRRDEIATFLNRKTEARVFLAEDVWLEVGKDPRADALTMEEGLARLADLIIIIVESAGTFTELGAFSMQPELSRKLLPILNKKFESDRSFINAGPVKKIEKESFCGPPIHADFNVILTCANQLIQRIDNLPKRRPEELTSADILRSERHYLTFLVDLISIAYPVTQQHLRHYVREILGAPKKTDLTKLLQLGVSLELLKYVDLVDQRTGKSERYYGTVGAPRLLRHEYVPHSQYRARLLNVLQTLPTALTALKQLRNSA